MRRAFVLVLALAAVPVALSGTASGAAERAQYERASVDVGPNTLKRSARRLKLFVVTGHCTAEDPADRVEGVRVRETRWTVTVRAVVRAEQIDPATACPAIGVQVPVKAKLKRRLGRRAIRDGSSTPPRFIARAR